MTVPIRPCQSRCRVCGDRWVTRDPIAAWHEHWRISHAAWPPPSGGVFTWGDHTGAHVAMWMTYHRSAVPPGCCICHSCDVPACINPDHLWLGDAKSNARDRSIKGRTSRHNVPQQAEYATRTLLGAAP